MRIFFFLFASLQFCFVAKADVFTFETPSENIQCVVGLGEGISDITCTIIERYGDFAKPKPESCNSDWGHTFELFQQGPTNVLCTPLNSNKDGFDKAPYGVNTDFNGIKCNSARKGFECRNKDGNGFFLSRQKQIIYDSNQQEAPSISKITDSSKCLTAKINGQEYPLARNEILKEGWSPKSFFPPFEYAPFTDWVKDYNYSEVEACAGTGTAPCKFVFESKDDETNDLLVYTQGEDIGIVTGHECIKSGYNSPLYDEEAPVYIDGSWQRSEYTGSYAAEIIRPNFGISVHCLAADNTMGQNYINIIAGFDNITGDVTLSVDNFRAFNIKLINGYFYVDSRVNALLFDELISQLKSGNSLRIETNDNKIVHFELSGSNKAIDQCPARNIPAN